MRSGIHPVLGAQEAPQKLRILTHMSSWRMSVSGGNIGETLVPAQVQEITMPTPDVMPVPIDVAGEGSASGLLLNPKDARAVYVFAHGAGAGMAHASMAALAKGLAERGIATLRYQF